MLHNIPCTRCGECCRVGGTCTLRRWDSLPDKFLGTCELLNGSDCRAIADMLSDNSVREWDSDIKSRLLKTFVGVGCSNPSLIIEE